MELERVFDHAFPREDDLQRAIQLIPSPFVAGEWYLVKHKGQILRFSEDPEETGHSVALDIRDDRLFVDQDEMGIKSLAFHPGGEYAFLIYSAPPVSDDEVVVTHVSRFDVTNNYMLDADSEVVFLEVPQPDFPHAGNQVLFGPDGYLYIAFGDGGVRGDALGNGQNPNNFYATILRIDVDQPDGERGSPYSIPPDNPFADGIDGAPEVYAYGLRNVWRFSFDRETDDLWAGDVGESDREEVNLIEAGGNYGWSIKEGTQCFRSDECDSEGLIEPIVDYNHDDGISVTGGYVYRGGDIPALTGRYVFADYIIGLIWSIDAEGEAGMVEKRLEARTGFWISSFAESLDGEVYVIRWSQTEHYDKTGPGGIYKLTTAPPQEENEFPQWLSRTGCMDSDDTSRAANQLIPYTPIAKLWSDDAFKERYISLPEGGRIRLSDDGDFVFPEGTVLLKHFGYNGRLHETRLYVHHYDDVGWRGYSYRWNDTGTDAQLLRSGQNEVLNNGNFWRYPSRAQCTQCHTQVAGVTLGLETAQLDTSVETASGETFNQLDLLLQGQHFAPEVTRETLDGNPDLVDPFGDAPLAERARSYLHSNCANCHQDGGPPRTDIDLLFGVSLEESELLNQEPHRGDLGTNDPSLKLVVPGEPEKSILYLRMTDVTQDHRMPPLGTAVVDEAGAALIREWIESM